MTLLRPSLPIALLMMLALAAPSQDLFVDASNPNPGTGLKVDPFQSITQALDVAGPFTTIYVAPGTYSPSLTGERLPISIGTNGFGGGPVVDHTGLKLIATHGPAVTIIDAEGAGIQALRFFSTGANALVRGFTITGSTSGTGIVRAGSTSPGYEAGNGWTLTGCIIKGGSGAVQGLATFTTMQDVRIVGNWIVGPFSDNAAWLSNESLTVLTGLFAHNTVVGSNNNGIRIQGGNWTVRGNIIANHANRGVYDRIPATAGVFTGYTWENNCYFGNGVDISTAGGAGTGLVASTSALFADPVFVDAANGDYHLAPTSPAIDAAVLRPDPAVNATDIDGAPRVVSALGNALAADLGGDEYADARLDLVLPPSISVGVCTLETLAQPGDFDWKFLALDDAQGFYPGIGNLLLDLGSLGFLTLEPLPVDPSGSSSLNIPVFFLPPSLVGQSWHAQSLVIGPSGLRFTNPVLLVIEP